MVPPPQTFTPIAPQPGVAVPRVRRAPSPSNVSFSGAARTTRARGTKGRFESSASSERRCALCERTETSQWRTAADGRPLCNACGIRLNRRTVLPPGKSAATRRRAAVQKAAAAASAARRRAAAESEKKSSRRVTAPITTPAEFSYRPPIDGAAYQDPVYATMQPRNASTQAESSTKKHSLQHILNPQ